MVRWLSFRGNGADTQVSPAGGQIAQVQLPETLRSYLILSGAKVGQYGLRRSSTSDLESFGQVLGEGTYGRVMLRVDKYNGVPRAVKSAEMREHFDRGRLVREAEILQNLDHPHLVRLYGWHEDRDMLTMVMESCAGGELMAAVATARSRREAMHQGWSATVFSQLFQALAYCNDRGLVHRDIKTGNIMLLSAPDPEVSVFKTMPHAIIVDFGLAEVKVKTGGMFSKSKIENIRGTATTLAPEVWNGTLSPKADIWSMGVVFYEYFTGRLPFRPQDHGYDMEDFTKETWLTIYKHEANWVPLKHSGGMEATDFCQQLLSVDESKRPLPAQCLHHEWFARFLSWCPVTPHEVEFSALKKALVEWSSLETLQRAVHLKMAADNSMVTKLAKFFCRWDVDRNGVLTFQEFYNGLTEDGQHVDEDIAKALFRHADANKDGVLEWLEFAAASLTSLEKDFDELLWQEYKFIDVHGGGAANQVNLNRLGEKLKALLQKLTDVSKVEANPPSLTVAVLDQDGDGVVSWQEWASFFGRRGVAYNEPPAEEREKLAPLAPSREVPAEPPKSSVSSNGSAKNRKCSCPGKRSPSKERRGSRDKGAGGGGQDAQAAAATPKAPPRTSVDPALARKALEDYPDADMCWVGGYPINRSGEAATGNGFVDFHRVDANGIDRHDVLMAQQIGDPFSFWVDKAEYKGIVLTVPALSKKGQIYFKTSAGYPNGLRVGHTFLLKAGGYHQATMRKAEDSEASTKASAAGAGKPAATKLAADTAVVTAARAATTATPISGVSV
eukprot:TRINITY_DN25296_c0_g2_i1.p1 TRINITY_DN25296_c0_g2~~TRINITY_DN25296_c0_g2_i1.p1  ORF type:complete len:784 (+),score=196.85 TRINITY_DN25296_c0_g2_i1:131-2482(+)